MRLTKQNSFALKVESMGRALSKKKYKVTIRIKDTYDFDLLPLRGKKAIINLFNNVCGYIPQRCGLIHIYDWEICLSYYIYI